MVPPLSVPLADQPASESINSEAVRLFVERAQAIRSDFSMTANNDEAIVKIVQCVEGLPLAVELAAARLAHLTPTALLERLDRRLPLLTGGARDLPDRHRTLRDAIAWSYDLLTPDEQRVVRSQTAFVGGCTLEAAEYISHPNSDPDGVLLNHLAALVSKSLLRQEEDVGGGPPYTMLETIREFGLEQLVASSEEQDIRNRHAAYFVELAERADPAIWGGPDHVWWLDRLEAEFANLEAAMSWLENSGNGPDFLRLAAALGGLWQYRSHRTVGHAWLMRALRVGGDTVPSARAMAIIKLSLLERALGGPNTAEYAEEGLALRRQLGDQRGIGHALINLGCVYSHRSEYDLAVPMFEEAATLLASLGQASGLASATIQLGLASY